MCEGQYDKCSTKSVFICFLRPCSYTVYIPILEVLRPLLRLRVAKLMADTTTHPSTTGVDENQANEPHQPHESAEQTLRRVHEAGLRLQNVLSEMWPLATHFTTLLAETDYKDCRDFPIDRFEDIHANLLACLAGRAVFIANEIVQCTRLFEQRHGDDEDLSKEEEEE